MSSILQQFEEFRQDIDDYNDRRERLIKLTRDATNHSKKTIFFLQRAATERSNASAVQQSREKFAAIIPIFEQMCVDLEGENFWRHQKTISGGIQEYIEALSLAHYLEYGNLLSFQKVQESIPFPLAYTDYLLGVSDLTGELMRFAITSLGHGGMMSKESLSKALEICYFVRACRSDWEYMTPHIRELRVKQNVTTNSLKKIEAAAYSAAIREFEKARLDDFDSHHISPCEDRDEYDD